MAYIKEYLADYFLLSPDERLDILDELAKLPAVFRRDAVSYILHGTVSGDPYLLFSVLEYVFAKRSEDFCHAVHIHNPFVQRVVKAFHEQSKCTVEPFTDSPMV